MSVISAADELTAVPGIPAKESGPLVAAGLHTVADLLEWLPRRYEDRRRFDAFPAQAGGPPVCLRARVEDCGKRFGPRGRFFEAVVVDASGGVFGSSRITCRWFNMPYIGNFLAAGHEVILYGKPKDAKGRMVIDHPEFEIVRDDDGPSIHLERIVPIYRNITGIPQRRLRELIHQTLGACDRESVCAPYDVDPAVRRYDSFRAVHFPDDMAAAQAARRRFALEEFFALQLNVVWRRARHSEQAGRVLGTRTTLLKRFYESLPFDLTGAQKRSIREIVADMRLPRPMNRLLQGDVGSGKTFVAMAAMLLAVDAGCQAALMAPTQILAEQHYLTFRRWLEPLGVRLALRTGSREDSNHLEIEGRAQIVIGTHALLYETGAFHDLGLVVVDEQHKFGVAQRGRLIGQGVVPDVLVMTATPIPRTLTMTIYGDLDVSVLDEKPAGRGKIVTGVRAGAKQTDITKFIKDQMAAGRQAYLVYPLVEESGTLKAESVSEAYPKWRKRLSGCEVGLLHGKLAPEEKEDVMRRFRDGDISALVATSVIEVGVDVANASVMIIHHAERFGLAQLHQLRGRIGRGPHKSYCVLLTDGKNPEAMEKLAVLERTSDGFEIAEADLRFRGPGDVLGTAQSGMGEMKFTDFLADTHLLRHARELAEAVIRDDPRLDGRHGNLRQMIAEHDGAVVQA
jgi:ATP-dependent DNA helicase RecG